MFNRNIFIILLLLFSGCETIKAIGNIIIPINKNKCNVISCYEQIVVGCPYVNLCFCHLYKLCYAIKFLSETDRMEVYKEVFNDPEINSESFETYDSIVKYIVREYIAVD